MAKVHLRDELQHRIVNAAPYIWQNDWIDSKLLFQNEKLCALKTVADLLNTYNMNHKMC
jgi:hypothetical protein